MTPSALTLDVIRAVQMPMMDTREHFIAFMKYCHGIMRASGPLLQFAMQRSSGALHDYFKASYEEEAQHGAWLAEDMALLGEAPVQIDHAVAATAGAQYYYMEHVGPQAFLGYIAALEFRPMPLVDIERLESLFGAAPIRTLRHHAEHDPEHAQELARVIDAQGDEFAQIIAYNAFVTAKMLAYYINERMRP